MKEIRGGGRGGAEVEREKNRRARSWRGMSLSSSNEPSKRKRERTTSIVVPGRFGSFRRARTACFQAVRSGAVWQPWPKARWHGTHCPRRLLLRDETSRRTRERARVRESKRGGGNEREGERAKERKKRRRTEERKRDGEAVEQPARRRSNRQTQGLLFPSLAFFPSSSLRLRLLLLLLSFARGPCRAEDRAAPRRAKSKPPMRLAEAPGSRSRLGASLLLTEISLLLLPHHPPSPSSSPLAPASRRE